LLGDVGVDAQPDRELTAGDRGTVGVVVGLRDDPGLWQQLRTDRGSGTDSFGRASSTVDTGCGAVVALAGVVFFAGARRVLVVFLAVVFLAAGRAFAAAGTSGEGAGAEVAGVSAETEGVGRVSRSWTRVASW